MAPEVLVASIALIVSLFSIVLSIYSHNEGKRMSKYQLNIELLVETEKSFKDVPALVELHNISLKSLAADGINMSEFHYILSSLRASEAYYVINNKQDELSFFRTNFLNNDKVKLAYIKYLRNNFFSQSTFRDLIDKHYTIV